MGLFGVLLALRWAGSWRGPAAVLVGIGMWLALEQSGIDPVIAGLAIGLVTSAYPPARGDLERSTELARSFREQPTPELAYSARAGLVSAISPNERLQYRLHPWTSRVIVPLFALANAGIHISGGLLSDAATSPVTLGIVAAFVIGKPLGIMGAAWLASRPMFGGAPLTVTFPALSGGAAAAGAPFTVSVLIATLAFDDARLDEAKIGVLVAALLAPVLVWLATVMIRRIPEERRARQLGATADTIIDLAEDVDPERDHIRGRVDAPVTLIEYGDFECPYCGHAAPTIDKLLGYFGDELRYVFRHLPLNDVHPNAQSASEAAESAAAQGSFWEMHDVLMRSPDKLSPLDLYRHASELGLDLETLLRRHAAPALRRPRRPRRPERRRQRRLRHADVLHQRPAPPGRLRHRHPDGGGEDGSRRRGRPPASAHPRRPCTVQRRGRDSNPRTGFNPVTRLAGECLQPLGHLSGQGRQCNGGMSATLDSTPAADGFHMPAEWAPHEGCWMIWPERPDNWRLGGKPAQEAFAAVADRDRRRRRPGHDGRLRAAVRPRARTSCRRRSAWSR